MLLCAANPAQAANKVSGFTLEKTNKNYRLSFKISPGQDFLEERKEDSWILRLPAAEGEITAPPQFPPKPGVLGLFKAGRDALGLKLTFNWSYPIPTTVTREGERLIVDFSRDYSLINRTPLAQGIMMEQLWFGSEQGPLAANIIRADLNTPGVRLVPTLAFDNRFGLDTTSSIAKRNGAIAAVNGSFFHKNGQPAGLLVLDHKIVTGPLFNRSVLGLRQNEGFIDNTQLSLALTLSDGQSAELEGINQPRQRGQVILYDHFFGSSTNTNNEESIEYLLTPQGTVMAIAGSNTPIPKEGYVLSASGAQRDWLSSRLKVGESVRFKSLLNDYWEDVPYALGGGPTLIRDGKILVSSEAERFAPDVALGKAPRTAVGITPYGELLLVVVDGRQPRHSVGLTLPELAKFLLEMGAKDAINLDGGGSSTVFASGMVVNRASDGHERKVGNALLLYGLP
ncbi:MAG TPA: phosphodiester glycosidase family protein [Chroococcales cyanobacterium]